MKTCDELPFALGWIAPEPEFMQRASHALVTAAGVYLVDPVDVPGAEERVRQLGTPAGVIQLLDRHQRDSRALADRLGVPLHEVPFDGIPGSPFEVIAVVSTPVWKEVALWWPEHRTLVVADAVGSAPYYRAPGEPLAVSPVLRGLPPRRLSRLRPEHVLCGHGAGVHGRDAAPALHRAVAGSRRRAPAWLLARVRERVGR
jgi:hypothetical protein